MCSNSELSEIEVNTSAYYAGVEDTTFVHLLCYMTVKGRASARNGPLLRCGVVPFHLRVISPIVMNRLLAIPISVHAYVTRIAMCYDV